MNRDFVSFEISIGCVNAKTCTLILRGGSEQFLEETERSLHDAIMIVRRTIKNDSVVAGGGAIEMELSKMLRDHSRTIAGKEQLLIGAVAKALEIIPRQLCDNAGFDATNILNKLRQKHAQGRFRKRHLIRNSNTNSTIFVFDDFQATHGSVLT